MSNRRRILGRVKGPAAAGSWLALVAATTLGDGVDTVRARVQAEGLQAGTAYRLVVQSYDDTRAGLPSAGARPVGSVQRAVTADELREGVDVSVVGMRDVAAASSGARPAIVAWIEAGAPDLEFDGRRARPRPGSVYGTVRRALSQDAVRVRLDRVAG